MTQNCIVCDSSSSYFFEKKYDSYKNSGIEWLGEILVGWASKSQLRRCCLCVTPRFIWGYRDAQNTTL